MADPLKFAMVFTADTSKVKPATQEVRTEVEAVANEAEQATSALDKNSAALERNATAAKKAADASRDQAKAESAARAALNNSTGGTPAPVQPSTVVPPAAVPPAPGQGTGPASGGPTAKQLEDLRAQYVPLYAAQRDYQNEIVKIQQAEKDGALTADQSALALARLKLAYDNQVISIERANKAATGAGGAIKLTAQEYQLFAHNVSDTVQSLALGIPIQQVLLQQGPQITQTFGGIGNAAKALGGILTVGNIALAGTAAAIAVAGLAWNSYLSSIKEVETAASGVGRSVAGSAADMEAAAEAGATAAGISVKAARSMEAEFLNTGKIGSQNFQQLISVSKDFATTLGISSDAAGSALADLFADPAKAAQTLYHQYGLIDGATAEYATRLAAQNRLSDAQSVLLDALPSRLAKATEATTLLGRAWENTANFASNAYDAIGHAIDRTISGPSLAEQVAAAKKALDEALSTKAQVRPGLTDGILGRYADSDIAKAQSQVDILGPQLRRQQEQEALRQTQEQARAAGANADTIARQSPANATQLQIQAYQDQIAALQRGANAADQSPEAQKMNNDAIVAKSAALATLINKQASLSELDRLDIQIQNERNPLIQADLAGRREKIQQTLQETNASEAEAAAERARNQVIEATIASNAAQAGDMRAELAIRQRLDAQVAAGTLTSVDAQQQIQEEIQLRPLVIAAAAAEGDEKIRLTKVLNDLKAGYEGLAEEQKKASAQDFIKSQQDNLQILQAQKSVLGESETAQARVLAQLQAEQEIRNRGLETSSDEAKAIRTNATAIADMNSQLDKAKDAWSTYKSAGSDAIDTIFDGLAAGDKVSDIGKSLVSSISKAALQLGVENPIKNALFGTNLGTFSDLFSGKGGALSSVAAQTVGSMNVTAATVVVNGGVTGGLGGAATSAGSLLAANSNIPTGDMASYAGAIKSIESGGNYSALGPVTASGDRALGAYQVMSSNVPSWTKGAVGQSLTADQFVNNPGAQDAVFNKYFGASVSKFGNPQDAASTWFTGRPLSQGAGASDMLGTTGSAYVDKFNAQLAKSTNGVSDLGTATGTASKGVNGLGDATGTAANGLDSLGGGLSKFGQALASAKSGGNNVLSSLLGSLTSYGQSVFNSSAQFATAIGNGGLGLYDGGGYTGPGGVLEPRGVVHAGEVVWSQQNVADAGGPHVVEAMRLGKRGYSGGGAVDVGASPLARIGAANSNQAPTPVNVQFTVQNNNGSQVDVKRKDTAQGVSLELIVDDAVSKKINTPGSKSRRAMQGQFGLSGGLSKR